MWLFGHWFSLTCSEQTNLEKNFFNYDLEPIKLFLKEHFSTGGYGISRVGYSFVFNIGSIEAAVNNVLSGIHNFIEIMSDGSVKCRVILLAIDGKIDISLILCLNKMFKDIYSIMLGNDLYKIFISAHKYEKLTILRQFTPYFQSQKSDDGEATTSTLKNILHKHTKNYGRNLIIQGNRVPKNDFNIIDKRFFDNCNIDFNNNELIDELFWFTHFNLGFIGLDKNGED